MNLWVEGEAPGFHYYLILAVELDSFPSFILQRGLLLSFSAVGFLLIVPESH